MAQHGSRGQRPPRRRIRGADDAVALLRHLEEAGYSGPRYDMFEHDLWLYGWDVVRGMIRTGRIAHVETGAPHGTISPADMRTLRDSTDEREALVLDTLTRAVPAFVDHLKHGRYRPQEGASLSTYFVGTCAGCFWQVYRSWSTKRGRRLELLGDQAIRDAEGGPDPSALHEQRDTLQRILKHASAEQRAICAGILQGKTQAEIATGIGLTARAVEGRLYQLRRVSRSLVRRGLIDRDHAVTVLQAKGAR